MVQRDIASISSKTPLSCSFELRSVVEDGSEGQGWVCEHGKWGGLGATGENTPAPPAVLSYILPPLGLGALYQLYHVWHLL